MPVLNSKIGIGHTSHTRLSPVSRHFNYRLNYLFIDLDEMELLNNCPLFKWNSNFLFSLHYKNYLIPGPENLRQKLHAFIKKNAPDLSYKSAHLLTAPTFFGINFNPVSFFYLTTADQQIVAIIAEVHNTYKQKHMYVLRDPVFKGKKIQFDHIKQFHVSPFFNVEGNYSFLFEYSPHRLGVSICYNTNGTPVFKAHFNLKLQPLKPRDFYFMGTNFAATALSTFPRILTQAAILKIKHRLPHFKNEGLQSPQSFSRQSPSLLSKWCMRVLSQYLKKITTGQLTISCPRGEQLIFGQGQPQAHIIVDDYRFFNALVFKSDIGLADAFIHQFWRTNHLQSVFDLFINNPAFLNSSNPFIRLKKRTLQFQHLLNANSITRAKKNIFDHYDLGNDFFNLFLDQHRVYSSAIFDQPDQSIEDAQLNKIRHAIRLADIQPHHRLLEIGSGWGALAIEAASSIGCHVTTVTISQEQYRFVKQEINRRHLDAKIEVKLMDYRLLTGKFDRIISIEMLEAVGHNYLNTYFRKCNDLLLRNGKAMFQCIMIPHNRYHLYLKSQDFIQKYIFPGGHLPSIETLKSVTANANFSWLHTVPITSHYVKTLLIWEQNFIRQLNRVRALGFNQHFIQTWIYYFNYCIAGFKSDVIQNYQFLIQKQH